MGSVNTCSQPLAESLPIDCMKAVEMAGGTGTWHAEATWRKGLLGMNTKANIRLIRLDEDLVLSLKIAGTSYGYLVLGISLWASSRLAL